MIKIPDQTIIQKIQPQCDNLHIALRNQKEIMHMTNQDVADITGLPLSNVAKFFSGNLSSPNVFNVMAVCICLNQSLDELFGNKSGKAQDDGLKAKVLELEAENNQLKKELAFELKLEDKNEKTVKHLEDELKVQTRVITGLVALCAIMTFSLLIYLVFDINSPEHGFVKETHVSPALLIIIAVIVAAIGVAIYSASKIIKRKKDGIHE